MIFFTFFLILLLCAAARSSSQRLRGDVDNLITHCANDMWSSWTNSNTALQQRVTESQDTHSKLQSHMAKTMQEIYDQEKHIQALKKAVRDKEAPLKVSLSLMILAVAEVVCVASFSPAAATTVAVVGMVVAAALLAAAAIYLGCYWIIVVSFSFFQILFCSSAGFPEPP